MSIRDHFRKKSLVRTKLKTVQDKAVTTDETESIGFVEKFRVSSETFYPPIDYSDPINFSRYSNPFDSYEVTIKRICEQYPYDGTLEEKLDWENSNSFLDRHLFEREYPRRVGHVSISSAGWGSKIDDQSTNIYGMPTDVEYISIKGGPHTGITGNLPEAMPNTTSLGPLGVSNRANRFSWDSSEETFDIMRRSNLYSSGTSGNTIEFWFKSDGYDQHISKRQVVFDMWNNIDILSAESRNYGRIRVEYSEEPRPIFYFTYIAPSTNDPSVAAGDVVSKGVLDCVFDFDSNRALDYYNDWHHIAITAKNKDSNLEVKFYVDGTLVETKTALNQACAAIPAPHVAQIGSLITRHELDQLPLIFEVNSQLEGYTFAPNGSEFRSHPLFGMFTEENKRFDPTGILNDAGTAPRLLHDPTSIRVEFVRVFQVPNGPLVPTDDLPLTAWNNPDAYQNSTAKINGVDIPNFLQQILAGRVLLRAILKTSEGITLQDYFQSSGVLDVQYNDLNVQRILSPQGSGKLQASIDDFRFWKSKRSSRQIGKWYVQQVGGGTNYSDANNTLGVYYKFNEGIYGDENYDSNVIDYSGRATNAKWIGKPRSLGRSEISAIETADPSRREFRDPIIYIYHKDVSELLQQKRELARTARNDLSSQLWRHIPQYIIEQNNVTSEDSPSDLKNLLNIIGSYLDELWLQIQAIKDIKSNNYDSFDKKPAPFLKRMLEHSGMNTPEIFIDSTIHELLHGQTEDVSFERDLTQVKNLIYQNIYSNLAYVYKNKGTMEGFDSLIRCFGIDDEILKVNLYATDTEYKFEDNYKLASFKRSYVDFYDPGNMDAIVYQEINPDLTESPQDSSLGYLPALLGQNETQLRYCMTFETEFYFPEKSSEGTAALFGAYAWDPTTNDFAAAAPATKTETGDFQVYAEGFTHDFYEGAKFILKVRLGDDEYVVETPVIDEVYNNTKWTFGVVVQGPLPGYQGGINSSFDDSPTFFKFIGCQTDAGTVINEFSVQVQAENPAGLKLIQSNLRCHLGSTRSSGVGIPSFDASLPPVHLCNANAGYYRVWASALNENEIRQHGIKPMNYGVDNPMFGVLAIEFGDDASPHPERRISLPKSETLMLNWEFENVSSSDLNGEFWVSDFSPGGPNAANPATMNIVEKINTYYTAKGVGFATDTTEVIDNRYIYAGRLSLPESVSSSDTIRILSNDDINFTLDSKPKRMYLAVEKSMYQNISQEMLKVMHSVTEFGSLVGAPVNKYRQDYKDLNKLREIFFRNIENKPQLEKYLQFYKWIDSSLSAMLQTLMPATVNQPSGQSIRNIIESHAFERNKYQHKFPELIDGQEPPETVIRGISELKYNWKYGHAPLNGSEENNYLWWYHRAIRSEQDIGFENTPEPPLASSGNAEVDIAREEIREAIVYRTSNDLPDTIRQDCSINLDNTKRDVPQHAWKVDWTDKTSQTIKHDFPYPHRRLNRHSIFEIDRSVELLGGTNFGGNKKNTFYQSITRNLGSNEKLIVDLSTIVDKPKDDELNVNLKRRLHASAHVGLPDADLRDADSNLIAPFSLYETKEVSFDESINSMNIIEKDFLKREGYAQQLDSLKAENNLDVTSLHVDSYGDDRAIPLQGPFASSYVGGHQHRNIKFADYLDLSSLKAGPLRNRLLLDGVPEAFLDNNIEKFTSYRPEAFSFEIEQQLKSLNIKPVTLKVCYEAIEGDEAGSEVSFIDGNFGRIYLPTNEVSFLQVFSASLVGNNFVNLDGDSITISDDLSSRTVTFVNREPANDSEIDVRNPGPGGALGPFTFDHPNHTKSMSVDAITAAFNGSDGGGFPGPLVPPGSMVLALEASNVAQGFEGDIQISIRSYSGSLRGFFNGVEFAIPALNSDNEDDVTLSNTIVFSRDQFPIGGGNLQIGGSDPEIFTEIIGGGEAIPAACIYPARALWMRDEYAKRPVNIRNIKTVKDNTAEYELNGTIVTALRADPIFGNHHDPNKTRLGNFTSQREIMQVGSRSLNNRDFVENTQNYVDLDQSAAFTRSTPERFTIDTGNGLRRDFTGTVDRTMIHPETPGIDLDGNTARVVKIVISGNFNYDRGFSGRYLAPRSQFTIRTNEIPELGLASAADKNEAIVREIHNLLDSSLSSFKTRKAVRANGDHILFWFSPPSMDLSIDEISFEDENGAAVGIGPLSFDIVKNGIFQAGDSVTPVPQYESKQNIDRNPSGEHIIVERFSAPGDIYTMGDGVLDRLTGQYSPYNALSFRNRKLINILNIGSSKVYNGQYGIRQEVNAQVTDRYWDAPIQERRPQQRHDATVVPLSLTLAEGKPFTKIPDHKVHRNIKRTSVFVDPFFQTTGFPDVLSVVDNSNFSTNDNGGFPHARLDFFDEEAVGKIHTHFPMGDPRHDINCRIAPPPHNC